MCGRWGHIKKNCQGKKPDTAMCCEEFDYYSDGEIVESASCAIKVSNLVESEPEEALELEPGRTGRVAVTCRE